MTMLSIMQVDIMPYGKGKQVDTCCDHIGLDRIESHIALLNQSASNNVE